MKKLLFVGFCAFSISSTAWSQPELVKDISSAPAGVFGNKAYATDERFIAAGQFLYFPVTDQKGKELWRTDGTPDGTVRVADINKGTADSYKMGVALTDGTFEFITQPAPGEIYSKLWRTNGTDAPELVGTIQDGDDPLDVRNIWIVNGNVMILGLNGPAIVLMQHSDSPLTVFKELANDESVSLGGSVMIGDDLLVLALQRYENFVYETDFWITDGTDQGTRKVVTYADAVENFVAHGNDIVFENSVQQVSKLNTTTGGITLLHDYSGVAVDRLFSFEPAASLISTREGVWVTDGTSANTISLLEDVVDIVEVFVSGGKAYFVGFDQANATSNLYETDGTIVGTKLLQQVRDDEATAYVTSPPQIGVIGNNVIVPVTTPQSGMEIATVNADGKSVIKDINEGTPGSDPHMFATFNNRIFFAADDGLNGMEVWMTDGTAAGTMLLNNIATGTGNGVTTHDLFAMNDEIFFSANTAGLNYDMWRTTGHGLDAELYFNTNSGNILGNTNDTIYFFAQPMKVYKSAGNGEAPRLVADLSTSVGDALHPSSNFFLGEKLIYNMLTLGGMPYGQELWTIDAHVEGTEVLKDINPGLGDGLFGLNYGDAEQRVGLLNSTKAVFAADDGTHGTELWITDGTTAGTTLLKDINAGSGSSGPKKIGAVLSGKLYFSADDGVHGDELWVTDGTGPGTKLVVDLNPDGSSQISDIVAMDEAIYFVANDGASFALFKTTGTANATKVDVLSSASSGMIALDHKLYIATSNTLWVSDGTMATDLNTGGMPANLYAFNNQVYFSANEQLWHSIGTANATQALFDIEPLKFKQSGDLLFMTAASREYGIELFKMSGSKFTQEIQFAVEDKTLEDDGFALAATTSSGLPVTYEVVSGNVDIEGNTVHILGPGSVTIKATQPGDDIFEPTEEVTATFCVKPATPVITAMQTSFTSSASEGNQWYLDGTAIDGAVNQTLSVTGDGNYTVQVSVDGCISDMSEISTIVGIAKETNSDMIYPNPVEKTLFVSSPASIRILDSNGRVVFNQGVSESLDVAHLTPGMYIAILNGTQYIKFTKR